MSNQDEYNHYHGVIGSHCCDLWDGHKAVYHHLVLRGADSAKCEVVRQLFIALVTAHKEICAAENDAALSVPGGISIQSGGGPKDDDDITSGP